MKEQHECEECGNDDYFSTLYHPRKSHQIAVMCHHCGHMWIEKTGKKDVTNVRNGDVTDKSPIR